MPRIPRNTIYWVRGDDERLNTTYLLDVPVSGVTNGQVVRYSSISSAYVPAQATAVASDSDPRLNFQAVGVAVNINGSTGDLIISNGKVAGFSGLVTGSTYYLSQSSAGNITQTRPEHGVVVILGIALSSTTLLVNIRVEESNPNILRGQPQSGCTNGQIVRWNGTNFVPASLSNTSQSVFGMIANISGSKGDIYLNGPAPVTTTLNPGDTYFLGSVAGSITNSQSTEGYIVRVGVAVSSSTILLNFNHNDGTPAGSMLDYAGTTAPLGWLMCDGAEYLKTAYPRLAAALVSGGTFPYGETNGSGGVGTTHFRVPDFRGRFARYNDNMGSGAAGRDPGRVFGTSQEDDIKTHSHSYTAPAYTTQEANPSTDAGFMAGGAFVDRALVDKLSTTTGGLSGTETRPKNLVCNKIIKF